MEPIYGCIFYVNGSPETHALIPKRFSRMLTSFGAAVNEAGVTYCDPGQFPTVKRFGYHTTDTGGGMREIVANNAFFDFANTIYAQREGGPYYPWDIFAAWETFLADRNLHRPMSVDGIYMDNCAERLFNYNVPSGVFAPPGYANRVSEVLRLASGAGLPIVRNISNAQSASFLNCGPNVTLFLENAPDLFGQNVTPDAVARLVRDCPGPVWMSPGFSRAPSREQAQKAGLALYMLTRREDTILGFSTGNNHAGEPQWMLGSWHPLMDEVRSWGDPVGDMSQDADGLWKRQYQGGLVTLRTEGGIETSFQTDPSLGGRVNNTDAKHVLRDRIAKADASPNAYMRLVETCRELGIGGMVQQDRVEYMVTLHDIDVQPLIDTAKVWLGEN